VWKCSGNRWPGAGAAWCVGFGLGEAVLGVAAWVTGADAACVGGGGAAYAVLDGATEAALDRGRGFVLAGRDDRVVRSAAGSLAGAAALLCTARIGGCAGRGVWLAKCRAPVCAVGVSEPALAISMATTAQPATASDAATVDAMRPADTTPSVPSGPAAAAA
jgi:hypothetical protein